MTLAISIQAILFLLIVLLGVHTVYQTLTRPFQPTAMRYLGWVMALHVLSSGVTVLMWFSTH